MPNQLTRYRLQEGTVFVPSHFQDRSLNNFVLQSNGQMVFNIAVGRDIAKPGETLEAWGKRQMAILENNLSRIKLISQESAQLGATDEMITGIQFLYTYKSGIKTVYQRQAWFFINEQRVLNFSASSATPFNEELTGLWQEFLIGFVFE